MSGEDLISDSNGKIFCPVLLFSAVIFSTLVGMSDMLAAVLSYTALYFMLLQLLQRAEPDEVH